jgi:hypothetical protein
LAVRGFSELPVVDREGKPVGILDITDIVAMYPESRAAIGSSQSSNSSSVPKPKNPSLLKLRHVSEDDGA